MQMSELMANDGRQIKLFLVDGSPTGIITAEIVMWTGKVLSAPRTRLSQLISREEAERTGIYVLIGPDPDRATGLKAYLGEADSVGTRLRHHETDDDKDFFDRVAFVVSKDENLTKAHARFLESQLIQLTKQAGTVVLANGTAPDFVKLPEADLADMAFFIKQLRIVLPILGFDLFRRAGGRPKSQPGPDGQSPVFDLDAVGVRATAHQLDDGFVVQAGSTARRGGTTAFPDGYRSFRDQLVKDGKLVDDGPAPDRYRFATDVAFTSPSAAAAVVTASAVSGPMVWKLRGTDQSYKVWRAANLADHGETS
jgi:hypothetical protein